MDIPEDLANAINAALYNLHHNPEYRLSFATRLNLYHTFPARNSQPLLISEFKVKEQLSLGDRIFAHLAILTAYHVLPVWNNVQFKTGTIFNDEDDDYDPYGMTCLMLELAKKKVLDGEIQYQQVFEQHHNEFYEGSGALVQPH